MISYRQYPESYRHNQTFDYQPKFHRFQNSMSYAVNQMFNCAYKTLDTVYSLSLDLEAILVIECVKSCTTGLRG